MWGARCDSSFFFFSFFYVYKLFLFFCVLFQAAALDGCRCQLTMKLDLSSTAVISEFFFRRSDASLGMGYVLMTEAGVGLGRKRDDGVVEIQEQVRWKELVLQHRDEKRLALRGAEDVGFEIVFDTVAEKNSFVEMLEKHKGKQKLEKMQSKAVINSLIRRQLVM
jgi:hypothetical protein